MLNLGVNIDHVATVRQARMAAKPEPLEAAMLAEKAGAWGITAHLREDRRHMQDADLALLAKQVRRLNMEMAVTDEMVRIALELRPHSSCLVPEKRQELRRPAPTMWSCTPAPIPTPPEPPAPPSWSG